jgi:hypothetical protein
MISFICTQLMFDFKHLSLGFCNDNEGLKMFFINGINESLLEVFLEYS